LIVVLAAVGLLGSTVSAYAALHVHGGEIFDATANRGHGDSAVLNQFVLRISRDGRSLVYRTVARRPLGFNTPIRHGTFSYGNEDDSSEYFTFSGRFSHDGTATGSVGLTGRDDCGVADLRWSGQHVGAGPTVTLVSH
jgi:hypothetical protein